MKLERDEGALARLPLSPSAPAHVLVDGVPYASFRSHRLAHEAIRGWRKRSPKLWHRFLQVVDRLPPPAGCQ